MSLRDVVIVGAGPAGLAAGIAATKAGLTYQIIEKGALVNSLLHYPTEMVFFTTPELMEIGGLPFVSPHDKPTRLEALRYYRRCADTFTLDIAFDESVTAIRRDGSGPDTRGSFTVETLSARGERRQLEARKVVLATGAYDFVNTMGVPGEDLPHVSHYFTTPHPFYRKPVVIVGGKNSAAEAALELYRAGAHVTIVHRRAALGDSIKYWVKPDIENRIKEESIAARFNTHVVEITPTAVVVDGPSGRESLPPPASSCSPATCRTPRSCAKQASSSTPRPAVHATTRRRTKPTWQGFYVIGAMVAGKASGKIFIENGRFHGQVAIEKITEAIGT